MHISRHPNSKNRFPTAAVLVALMLGTSILAIFLTRKERATPAISRDIFYEGRSPESRRTPSRSEGKSRARHTQLAQSSTAVSASDYIPPEGVLWHRAALEKSPEEWGQTHGRNLPSEARAEMLDYFRHSTNLTVRVELAEAMMSQLMGEDLVLAVAHAVTNDYRHLSVSSDDAEEILNLFSTIRFATAGSAVAFNLAAQAVEFEFWERHRPFARALDEDGREDRWALTAFSGDAIQALSFANSPQVPAILAGLRARDINYTYYMSSALVDAAYRLDLMARKNAPGFKGTTLGNILDDFDNWRRNTPNGRDWGSWSDALGKQRPTIKRD